jgi:hypothetical protein
MITSNYGASEKHCKLPFLIADRAGAAFRDLFSEKSRSPLRIRCSVGGCADNGLARWVSSSTVAGGFGLRALLGQHGRQVVLRRRHYRLQRTRLSPSREVALYVTRILFSEKLPNIEQIRPWTNWHGYLMHLTLVLGLLRMYTEIHGLSFSVHLYVQLSAFVALVCGVVSIFKFLKLN